MIIDFGVRGKIVKILVTGGSGFIGSAVVKALVENNHEVIVYDVETWGSEKENIKCIRGNIFEMGPLTEVLKECDGVIHMVGLPDARIAHQHPQISFDLNVKSLQVLLEAARQSSVSRLIFPSSAAIYGAVDQSPVSEETPPKPTSIYTYHKYIAEKLAEAYSLNYGMYITALRLFNVYGTKGEGILNILIEKAIKGELVKLYGEKQKRDFVHASDVANAFAAVTELEHKFEVYNVGTGVGRSIEDIVNLVKRYFPTLSVEHGNYESVLYDSVADITKIRNAARFSPDTTDNKLREVILEWSSK